VDDEHCAKRNQDQQAAEQLDPGARAGREPIAEDIDPHMGVVQVGITEAEHHHGEKEVPLEFL
jgi:hypothetical protein